MAKKNIIQPRTLKGFKDYLPKEKRARDLVVSVITETFEKYGFEPLETTNLEYLDILLGKYGEEEKLIYNFEDKGGRKVGLRYDLTVPTARVIAQYQNEISLPFKRYQIQKVWRAENTQAGRLREFYQCDADTYGSGDMAVDAEYILMSIEVLQKLGFTGFKVNLGNRKILDAVFRYSGAIGEFGSYVTAIDKIDKVGVEGVKKELGDRGFSDECIAVTETVLLIEGSNDEKLERLEELVGDLAAQGIKETREIINFIQSAGVEEFVDVSFQLARGLSYYTGPNWDTFIVEGNIGAVSGCGRYDKLVGDFLGRDIPATGGTWGLDRIVQIMMDRDMIGEDSGAADVLVTMFDDATKTDSFVIADVIRSSGLAVMLYPSVDRLGKQFKYADKKRIRWVVILGEDEVANERVTLKDMVTGEQFTESIEEALKRIFASYTEVVCGSECVDCNCE